MPEILPDNSDAPAAVDRALKHVEAAIAMRTASTPSLYPLATARLLEQVADALGTLDAELSLNGLTTLAGEGVALVRRLLQSLRPQVPLGIALKLGHSAAALEELEPADELPADDAATDDAVRRPDRPPEEHAPDEEPAR